MPTCYALLLDGRSTRPSPAKQKRALARAIVARFHGEDAAARRRSTSIASTYERELPDEIEEQCSRRGTAPCTSRRCRRRIRHVALEGRRLLAQGGVSLDGNRSPESSISRQNASKARAAGGKAAFQAPSRSG